jgi:hypothetical protein
LRPELFDPRARFGIAIDRCSRDSGEEEDMPVTYAGRAHWCSVRLAIFAGCLLAVSATRIAETAAQSAQPKPVARVGNETIGEDELTQNLRAQLARLERQRYELLNSRLEQLIDERLLAQEATRRGISVDQLLQSEVLSQIREATDTEVANFIKDNRNNLAEGDAGQVAQRVKDYLHSQRVTDGRAVYVRGLRKKTEVTVCEQRLRPRHRKRAHHHRGVHRL